MRLAPASSLALPTHPFDFTAHTLLRYWCSNFQLNLHGRRLMVVTPLLCPISRGPVTEESVQSRISSHSKSKSCLCVYLPFGVDHSTQYRMLRPQNSLFDDTAKGQNCRNTRHVSRSHESWYIPLATAQEQRYQPIFLAKEEHQVSLLYKAVHLIFTLPTTSIQQGTSPGHFLCSENVWQALDLCWRLAIPP